MGMSLVSVTYCRKTEELLSTRILQTLEVDEDEFYMLLVEVLGDAFIEQYKKRM